jgi:Co/Zn/Cd efflux system component
VSAWLLSGGHGHDHHHGDGHHHDHDDEVRRVAFNRSSIDVEIFEDHVPPRFRIYAAAGALPAASELSIEIVREDGSRQLFALDDRGAFLESRDEIPEPHAFMARLRLVGEGSHEERELRFEEHEHDTALGAHHRDNNMRAAVVHVMADAAVSVLVIVGLLLARTFGWLWMDPLAGLIGAAVIANWSVGLLRDTGAILLDRTPDPRTAEKVRQVIESEGDRVTDLHLWRLGPGHLGAIVSVATAKAREAAHYRQRLARFADLSHVTVEVLHAPSANS